ncbi:hypothetical protein D9C73_026929 [Collichthys lucidus]|uniref:Uncharacterized protein n=1 Tax=Collichthys lucidus TaxID=240159 RepID=A0A4U5VW94_COLLU|nr:hypothetical protein D9C73_026929 [Collichthys lucidus]
MDRCVSQPDRGNDEDNPDGSRGERPSGDRVAQTRATTAGQHLVTVAPWAPSRGPRPAAGEQSLKCLSPESSCRGKEMDSWTDS